jgi:hypothetical protein
MLKIKKRLNKMDTEEVDENDIKIIPDLKWTKEHELILVEWADKAMCYRWLHARCNAYYYLLNMIITIPVILFSTLTGTANFAQESFPEDYRPHVAMIIGGLNILVGFMSTVQQFLKVNELNEGHRVSSISWGKFYRNVKVEIARNPDERQQVTLFLKRSKEEFDLLMEVSPMIRPRVIGDFKRLFKNNDTFYRPEICDSLISTKMSVYNHNFPNKNEELQTLEIIKAKRNLLRKETLVEEFIKKFTQENDREPDMLEIFENLQEQVTQPIIENLLLKLKSRTDGPPI